MKKAKTLVIIPARYASTRLPQKMLIPIMGKTLLQRTYESAKTGNVFEDIVVATDHSQIYDHVCDFGGNPVITSVDCPTGTDRLAEVLTKHPEWLDADVIVNIQGDQPFVDPLSIQAAIDLLLSDSQAQMSTLVAPLANKEEASRSSVVKCVMDINQNALYFSRALLPSNTQHRYRPQIAYYHHIGIYVYRPKFILHYQKLPATPLQLEENLEQLKALEHGYRIKVALTNNVVMSVDTPEDLKLAEQWICRQNTFS